MKIQSTTIKGFRCFGETATTINLSSGVTAFVGANGTGKTAFLHALLRMFGVSPDLRTVKRDDFHTPPGTSLDNSSPHSLIIEVRLAFPELGDDSPSPCAIAPCFQHMQISEPGRAPFCRLRLEATWTDDGTLEGDVQQRLWWVLSDADPPRAEDKRPVEAFERSLIQVHYVPANREASVRLNYAAGTMVNRLLRTVAWSSNAREKVNQLTDEVKDTVRLETAIRTINNRLRRRWGDLYDEPVDAEPEMQFAMKSFEELIRRFSITFRPTEMGGERDIDNLSEGQQSLFYFSLVAALSDIEQELLAAMQQSNIAEEPGPSVQKDQADPDSEPETTPSFRSSGFRLEQLQIPALTVFAVEEPENHLAPYYLARIMQVLDSLAGSHLAQAVLTSHSPAILERVEPSDIRYCRLDIKSRTTVVTPIALPTEPQDIAKYVREAVRAYPELYFARFVVLGEGASEEVVIPRLASALGQLNLDRSFAAIVPLGGRHVHHFWRLLTQLQIPYATLLDLDLGRQGGGWARVKYVCDQLIAIGTPQDQVLSVMDIEGDRRPASDEDYQALASKDPHALKELHTWIKHLEGFGVYLSAPLDLDMMMLRQFPEAYKATIPLGYGPRVPEHSSPELSTYLNNAAEAILSKDDPAYGVYWNQLKGMMELFPWYRFLFLSKGKPSTHLLALSRVSEDDMREHAPPMMKRMLNHIHQQLHKNAKPTSQ